MKKEFLFALLITTTVFFSCSSNKYFIESGYRGQKITEATLLITKINNIGIRQDILIFNPVELDSIKDKFLVHLNSNLNKALLPISTFENVGHMEFKQQVELEKRTFNLNKSELIEVYVPKDKIPFNTEEKVFILFIQDGIIDLVKNQRETSDPAKQYAVSATPAGSLDIKNMKIYDNQLIFNTKYFIYDNSSAKVVLCGTVVTKYKYTERTNLEDLVMKTIDILAEEILENSPFKN